MTYLKILKDLMRKENELFSKNNPCIETSVDLIIKNLNEFKKNARAKKTMTEVIPVYKEYNKKGINILLNEKNKCEAN